LWQSVTVSNVLEPKLNSEIVLIHDDARLPSSQHVTQRLIQLFKLDIFEHPPCRSDQAPDNFFLSSELKDWP